jgi:hypothetical protein
MRAPCYIVALKELEDKKHNTLGCGCGDNEANVTAAI